MTTKLDALKAAVAAGNLRCIGADLELCDDYGYDDDGCPMLTRKCGTCRGCYGDVGDTEPEAGAECTGGYDLSCSLSDIIAALVDVAVSSDRLAEIAEFAADDDDCEYDHHGYCQVHGCGDMGDRETPHCPTAALKEQVIIVRAALAKLEEEA